MLHLWKIMSILPFTPNTYKHRRQGTDSVTGALHLRSRLKATTVHLGVFKQVTHKDTPGLPSLFGNNLIRSSTNLSTVILRLTTEIFRSFSVILGRSHHFLGIYQYLGCLKVSCSRTLYDGNGIRTLDLSLRSPKLYH